MTITQARDPPIITSQTSVMVPFTNPAGAVAPPIWLLDSGQVPANQHASCKPHNGRPTTTLSSHLFNLQALALDVNKGQ